MKIDQKSIRSYGLVIAAAIALGFLAQFQIVGVIFIAVYGVMSLVKRIASRSTFILALLALAATAVLLMIGRRSLAENFASYSFLLFIVAIINVCLEQWRLSKLLHKKQQRS